MDLPKDRLISDVRNGTPVVKAGLKVGDILIEFDGKENRLSPTHCVLTNAATRYRLTVLCGTEKITPDVTLEIRK